MQIDVVASQFRPVKADYATNLGCVGGIFAQLEASEARADLVVLPETALTGYFVEGGVIELARSADEVYTDLRATYLEHVRRPGAQV
ncbi:MAG: hypothetical protein FJX72_21395, partial [Armatimonadetes bacterium]|nr:hypothetical protein [Armatimonadota bacterium]